MRRWLFALAFALLATPAFAQGTELDPRAAPGSVALGLIDNANAEGVFELVPDGHATVRHVGSGMVCRFTDDGAGARIVVFPQLARGEDVACDSNAAGVAVTLYATRYPFETTLEDQLRGAEAAILQRFADAEPTQIGLARSSAPQRASAFFVIRDGVRNFTSVHVARIGDWIIKQRYTVAAPDAAAATGAAEAARAAFEGVLSEISSPANL
jgi:hypothetical protein